MLCLFCIIDIINAQDNSNNTISTKPLSKWYRMFPEVKYGDNIYNTGSNWFSVAYGRGLHTNKNCVNQNFSMAYHHRYHAVYFNAGWHFSSPEFFTNRPMEQLNDVHFGAGLRFEDRWYNFSFFIGPSLATTWVPVDASLTKIHNQLGAHTEVQMTFKYFYDLGLGTSLYGSFNKRYQVVGIQLHLYFSNAFVTKY